MNHQKADGSESKAEKMFIKMGIIKAFSQDDLKAIEGIGPKISELLMSNGIGTWKALADSSVSRLRTILDSQGSKYKLADPSTWPKQAQMAAEGDWDKLEEYQDFLNGGKDPS
jgi:predicted flap endonuclease-1-like 5' DNA nuclease